MPTPRWYWIAGLAGVGALAVGGIAYAATSSKSSSPTPSGQAFTATITDPNGVLPYQNEAAGALTDPGSTAAADLGLPPNAYTLSDVDGKWNNPKWMAVVSAFQRFANANLPIARAAGKLPAGFPAQLRTDGVLDYATAIVMQNV
jgi:hypothetical protein